MTHLRQPILRFCPRPPRRIVMCSCCARAFDAGEHSWGGVSCRPGQRFRAEMGRNRGVNDPV